MSNEFADPVASLGTSVMRQLRNATARFNGGDPVDGIFENQAEVSAVGGIGMFARAPRFRCLIADLPLIDNGLAVEVSHPAATAPYYSIKQRVPDDLHRGWAGFWLEPRQ